MSSVSDAARLMCTSVAIRCLAFLCLSAAIAYIQRAALSVPADEIAGDLEFADLARDMGWIQSAWYLCYGLMQMPSGWLADRMGSRRAPGHFFCRVVDWPRC